MDNKLMKRCLELASKALQSTSPNPMVGSVIVCNGEIIGEGYHIRAGGPHAEVHAIRSVKNQELLKKSTLYVNLEPCAHQGRTPACSRLIIEKGIPEVVIGSIDPFSEVSGRGVDMLRAAGIKVRTGVLEEECNELNKRFFTFHKKQRPYVILKWAQSADGFIDKNRSSDEKPAWLTNETARMLVHKWRAEEGAVLVGRKTALLDNPQLNVRDWHGENPLRIVLDPHLSLPDKLHVFDQQISTLILNSEKSELRHNIEYLKIDFDRMWIDQLFRHLHERNILSLFVEGGKQVLDSFIQSGMWDEARVFYGHANLMKGVAAPDFSFPAQSIDRISNCTLKVYYNLLFKK